MSINKNAQRDLHYIDQLTGIDFEKYMVKILNQAGYHNVKRTSDSNDGGLDAYGLTRDNESIGWQFKNYDLKHDVPYHAVEEVISGSRIYGTKINVVITNSYFSNQTIEKTQDINMQDPQHPVRLVDRNRLLNLLKQYEVKSGKAAHQIKRNNHIVKKILQTSFVQKIVKILQAAHFKDIHRTQKSILYNVDVDCYSNNDLRFGIIFLLTHQSGETVSPNRVAHAVKHLYTDLRPFTHVLLITNGKFSPDSVKNVLKYNYRLTSLHQYPTYYIQMYDQDSIDQLKHPQSNEASDGFNSSYYQSITSTVTSVASASASISSSEAASSVNPQVVKSQIYISDSSASSSESSSGSSLVSAGSLNTNLSSSSSSSGQSVQLNSSSSQDSQSDADPFKQLLYSSINSFVAQSKSAIYSSAAKHFYNQASFCTNICKLAFQSMSSSATSTLKGQLNSISAYRSVINSKISDQNHSYYVGSLATSASISSVFDSQASSLSEYESLQQSSDRSFQDSISASLSGVVTRQQTANQSSFASTFRSASAVFDNKFESTYQFIQHSLNSTQTLYHQSNANQLISALSSLNTSSRSLKDYLQSSLADLHQSVLASNSYQQSLSSSAQVVASQSASQKIASLQSQAQVTATSASNEIGSFVNKFAVNGKTFRPFITKMSNNIFLMDSLLKSLDSSMKDQFSVGGNSKSDQSAADAEDDSKSKICPYCGQRCAKSDYFCKNCGRLIKSLRG